MTAKRLIAYNYMTMKSFSFCILLSVLAGACARPPATVPEVTPQLEERHLKALEDDADTVAITRHHRHLILVRSSGAILKIDPIGLDRLMAAQLTEKVRKGVISGDGRMLLSTQASPPGWIVFDLDTFREIARLTRPSEAEEVVAIGRDILVTRNGNRLTLTFYASDPQTREIDISENDFRACQVHDGRALILLRQAFMRLSPPDFRPERIPLPHAAAGDFLLHQGNLYYGSENRRLVKWSFLTGKTAWAVPLPRTLSLAPLKAGELIAVLPRDQHIHFFTPAGGHAWWSPLNGTRLFPPLLLEQNIAVFLYPPRNPEIRFFNWKKQTSESFKITKPLRDPPLAVGGRIFFLTESEGKNRVLTVANIRKIDIQIEPKFPRVSGKSLEFRLNAVNLIQPEFTLSLRRSDSKTPILETRVSRKQTPSVAWFARDPGNYLLEVEASSRDGLKVKASSRFRIADPTELTRAHVSAVQADCDADHVVAGDAKP